MTRSRLVIPRDRDEVVSSHAALRVVVSRYCGGRPSELRFRFGEHGKPGLVDATRIAFNLSHARGVALMKWISTRMFCCARS